MYNEKARTAPAVHSIEKGRREMIRKSIACALLIAVLALAGAAPVFAADVDYNQWNSSQVIPSDVMNTKYRIPVNFLMRIHVVSGYEDGLFHPDWNITRAEFAKMMAIATNNDKNLADLEKQATFSDIADHWARGYINGATKAGLLKGVGDNQFNPEGKVTYAEVITVLIRMNKGAAQTAEAMAATWPENYIKYAEMYNFKGDTVITDWNVPATRGDVAYLLFRRIGVDQQTLDDYTK